MAESGGITCAEIAGRSFGDVSEHAAYLRGGGCARVVHALCA